VALDGASRAAARRIAAQLVRHEAEHGATAALDATARCGRMLKRRVTPGVAAAVEGAAAATRVGDAVAPASAVAEGASLDRHVATAGDALLVVLTTAAQSCQRQLGAFEASRREKKGDIERLLARGDALAARVPSRRVAAALRALHRDALALIDARARLAAADACLAFLRETVGEAAAGSVGRAGSESDASAEALFPPPARHGGRVLRGARARGLASARAPRRRAVISFFSLFLPFSGRARRSGDASGARLFRRPRGAARDRRVRRRRATNERTNEQTNRLRRRRMKECFVVTRSLRT
jgi:hypothetical protein